MTLLETALEYARRGFSIIPVKPEIDPIKKKALKKPFILWEEYQKRTASEEEIRAWWKKWPTAMIGVVTGELSGVFIVDCDTKEGYEEIKKLIPDSTVVPIARTPRGGWHLWFIFPQNSKITIATDFIPGVDYRGQGGYAVCPPSITDDGKVYAWEQGLSINDSAIPTVPLNLLNNIYSYIGGNGCGRNHKDHKPQLTTNDHKDHKMFENGRRDADLFHVANCLTKGGMPASEMYQVLENLIISWGEAPDDEWIANKIKSALKRAERRERNITSEVRDWATETTNGYFETTSCHKELQLTTKEEMKAANMALLRMCDGPEAILEKHGSRRGCYRRVDKTIEFMDFVNVDPNNSVQMLLPMGIHTKTKFFPKAAVVIAGVSGMGKTLFCFNSIAMNMGDKPIYYFNAEMGPEQINMKLSYFPIPMKTWEKSIKVIDQWDFNNVSDKIQPDAFNVIDYLEPEGEKAYNIHGVISAIIRRLNKGMVLISIQKKPGSTLGTGGIYSIKASSLAMALDWGKIEIVKNRFREVDPDPSANKINFEVRKGYKFEKIGDWYK